MPMPLSIRRRLLVRLISAIVISWVVAICFVYMAAYQEVEEIYDAALAQQSRVLATLMTHEAKEELEVRRDLKQLVEESGQALIERSPRFRQLIGEYLADQGADDYLTLIDQKSMPGHRYESKIAFIVIDGSNKVLLRSNMPVTFDTFTLGFSERMMEGRLWRTFGLMEPVSKLRVQVGEQHAVRQETVEYIVFNSLWPLFAALPFIALLIWFTVSNGLKPLKQIAVKVERRDPNSLVPILPEVVPQEVLTMVESLNRLFMRVQKALDNERQFTADAAHELRTPLAALKTMAQAKQLSDHDGEHQIFLEQVVRGVDRTSHLLEQLLTLARMDSQSISMTHLQQVDLCKQVLEVLSQIGQHALDRGIELSYMGEQEGLWVKGNGSALQILIRNLIDNAIRYTPSGGQVGVSVEAESQEVRLVIEDTGPGIPTEQMSQVFQRFKRGEDAQTEGTGLGLSIVQRIIELHQGRIELENRGVDSGLRVNVYLRAQTNFRHQTNSATTVVRR
jgi:two-component system sensor histidine kinase QseC